MLSFAMLAVIAFAGIAGPLLAYPPRWHLPVVLGELMAGVALGATGLRYLHPHDPTFELLANIGFALVMFVAGSHVPLRDPNLRTGLWIGAIRAVLVGLVALAVAAVVSGLLHTGHLILYAVLMASSSAALVLPIVDSLGLGGTSVLQLLPQVALADAACIVALPLVIDPKHAGRAALGALAVTSAAVAIYLAFRWLERSGIRRRVHRMSEHRRFALELRTSLGVLFALAALANTAHVSIMLAGFAMGLAISAVGEPRRLARQLFALTEGFLGPLFFIWLGASINLRDLASHPHFVVVGLALGAGAVASHLVARAAGQQISLGMLAAAQLGVPIAAATVGTQLRVLAPGESAAILLGAVVSIATAVIGAGYSVRAGLVSSTGEAESGV